MRLRRRYGAYPWNLIGEPHLGNTSVGKRLARLLAWNGRGLGATPRPCCFAKGCAAADI